MGGSGTAVNKKGKVLCGCCGKKCSGEVLKVKDLYFHISCFKCKECCRTLAQGGFFSKDGGYYCSDDYQKLFGTRCAVCGSYVEGEVVTALGNTYHQQCFRCARCHQPFPAGQTVTYTGNECLCHRCVNGTTDPPPTTAPVSPPAVSPQPAGTVPTSQTHVCSGCKQDLNQCQALVALDRVWHVSCFKCTTCSTQLHGEYMARDGLPYCEKHYQSAYGVRCAYCQRFISGKVLQAGDNNHFHPTCARCTKCGDPFGDGEEMYLQGAAIWHPRCGPGPGDPSTGLNGHDLDVDLDRSGELDRFSTTASETQFSFCSHTPSLTGSSGVISPYSTGRKYSGRRSASPGTFLRDQRWAAPTPLDITRIYTQSYLTDAPNSGLRRPIEPYDKPPKSPHFHRPPSGINGSARRSMSARPGSRSAMQALVDQIESGTPRPRSPYMNNEEAIELSHFPDGRPLPPNVRAPIEREDFPAPPYPYTDPERRRRLSDKSSVHEADADNDTEPVNGEDKIQDAKLLREETELNKIATGIGRVFLDQVRERDRLKQFRRANVDPRSLSRAPNADRELPYKLRYHSPVYASPSRDSEHPRPWEMDEDLERGSTFRSSLPTRSFGATPNYRVLRSAMSTSRPGCGGKSCTLPVQMGRAGSTSAGGYYTDFSYGDLGEKTHSTDFSSAQSDVSVGSLTEADRNALNQADGSSCVHTPRTPYTLQQGHTAPLGRGIGGGLPRSHHLNHLRRSLPAALNSSSASTVAALPPAEKQYPVHLLFTTNYRLPGDVDRSHLERHLSDAEFELVFRLARHDFYRLPLWRRNDLKKRARLF